MSDLTFLDIQGYSDEELLFELQQRFTHCVFIGLKRNCDAEHDDGVLNDWCGDSNICYGLCESLKKIIKDAEVEDVEYE